MLAEAGVSAGDSLIDVGGGASPLAGDTDHVHQTVAWMYAGRRWMPADGGLGICNAIGEWASALRLARVTGAVNL